MKLSKGKFRLNIRKIFLTVRSIRMWNSPPGKTMETPLLESLKIDWKKKHSKNTVENNLHCQGMDKMIP